MALAEVLADHFARHLDALRAFGAVVEKVGDPRLASRAEKALAAAKQESP